MSESTRSTATIDDSLASLKSYFHHLREHVRGKNETAQFNEVLLKVLCHNICVVIQEMHELGILPDFTSGRKDA